MTLSLEGPPGALRMSANGVVRVGNTRVSLDLVLGCCKLGSSPEEIVQHFPSLDLKDGYAAVTYYLYNQAAVAAYLAEQARATVDIEREVLARCLVDPHYVRLMELSKQQEA